MSLCIGNGLAYEVSALLIFTGVNFKGPVNSETGICALDWKHSDLMGSKAPCVAQKFARDCCLMK